jgi:hypothetical protein
VDLYGPAHVQATVVQMLVNQQDMLERPPILDHRYVYNKNDVRSRFYNPRSQTSTQLPPELQNSELNDFEFQTMATDKTSFFENFLNNSASLQLPEAEPSE